jgi:ASPM-SPD-2-Hydin domain-containing protein/centrosomal CEP192-like protein/Ig-like domain-containing protein/immunoglobulin I-set domain protein/BACON domain-containing protein
MQITGKIEKRIWNAAAVLVAILTFGRIAHADMGASASSLSFGSQIVGSASSPQAVTLTNFTKNRVSIQSISTSEAQFRVSAPSIPVTLYRGDSLTVSVTFMPTAAQTYSDTLTFVSNNSGTVTVSLTGTGTTPDPSSATNSIVASRSSLTFSVQAGGAATAQSVSINDTTLAPLPFTVSADQSWITLSATSGTTQSAGTALAFGANPAGMSTGTYTGHVILVASGVTNSPLAIPVTLTITPIPAVAPSISSQPANAKIIAGQTATFSVTAAGTSPMTYQWSKNGGAIGGATSSTYTTPAETTADNNAQFTVKVSNSAGSATSNAAVLTVTSPAVAPSITTQPASTSVIAGNPATFSVAATGTSPMTYQWSKNGGAISGATSSSYTTPAETAADNNAQFTVNVSNSAGSATSNAAVLTVTSPAVAPTITTQPASTSVIAGNPATFSVAATGTSPMTYQWSKNGGAISGATSSAYTTPAETTADNNAQFTVNVSNSAGSATSNAAVLTVTSPAVAPTITTQPASTSVIAGNPATFSVAATGTSPMTYQWSKNGGAISGATSSSYTTPAETTADNNAQFTVKVSNAAGTATSNAATLTVNAAALVLNSSASSLSFGSVNVSSSSSKNVTLTNAGNANITISNVTVAGAGFNASGVSTGLILTPGQAATLTATFAPAATGSVTGSIAVASDATNSPDIITVSGTGAAVVNHSVALSWTASTSSVMGYNTYSSKTSGGPYTKLTSTPVAAMAYTDATVQSGLTYYYVVTSVDSSNMESAYSTEVSATVP